MPTPHEWLKAIGATESLRETAEQAGLSHATLSRQITAGRFLIETAIALARAYGTSPVAALVANGHLTEQEAGLDGIQVALAAASDEQLVIEVSKRMGIEGASTLFDAPASQAAKAAENVVRGRFPSNVGTPADDESLGEPSVKQPPSRKRTAARKGTRKADQAPHAD
ncbi:hypothetical protein IFU40_06340 [Microbacterium sp. CFBP 13617]|uniref:hypothetical protein n=1 Tax=Microbacterium sp. CFBP 13617 TaxID=2774035 RepID=UPI00178488B2|nr:hypothetical protein [Microbacterium sp. CFBP 13617]MBD8218252.1 hypothetical protein [Microbacterium sp. CFBP 13617]